jgi:carboxylesterase
LDVAARLGRRALAPLLPGHGTIPRDLQHATWEDWAAAGERALDSIAPRSAADPRSRQVIVAGMSLGSMVAIHLAATRSSQVAGLVVMSCAAWLPAAWPGVPLRVLGKVYREEWDLYSPKGGSDIRDPEAQSKVVTYDLNPIAAAIQVERAGRIVRRKLADVHCPVLVLHGALDRVCSVDNLGRLVRRLGTSDLEAAVLPRSGHIVTLDFDKDEVVRRVESFVKRVTPASAQAAQA